ncbi:hypothetical protein ACFL6E_02475 [Candidatus Neomarinimicrobiota bacterium]
MHRTIKWMLLKGLPGFLIVSVSVVAITAVFFSLPTGENILRQAFEKFLHQTLTQDVKIHNLETNLVSRLQIFQTQISPSDSGSSQPAVSVDTMRIHFWIGDLLRGKYIFKSIEVDRLKLLAIEDSNGVSNIPWLLGDAGTDTSDAERGLELRVDQLTVRHAGVSYADNDLSIQGILKGFYLDVAMNAGIAPFILGADSIDLNISSYPLAVTELALAGQWQDDVLDIPHITGRVQDMALNGGITFRFDPAETGLAGQWTLQGDLRSVTDYMEWGISGSSVPIEGSIQIDCELAGTLDDYSLEFNAFSPAIQLAGVNLHNGFAQGVFHADTIHVSKIALQENDGRVFASGWLVPYEPYPHHMIIQSTDLELADFGTPVTDYFQLQLPNHLSTIEGKMNLDCELAGTSNALSIGLAAQIPQLRIADVVLGDITVAAVYQQDTLLIHQFGLQAEGGTLQGSGWLVPSQDFPHRLNLHSVDLEMASLWQLAYGPDPPFTGRLSGSVDSRGSLAELSNLQINIGMNLSSATYLNRPIPSYSFEGHVSQGNAQLALIHGETEIRAKAQLNNEQLQGAFTAQISAIEHLLQLFDIAGISGSGGY